MGHLKTEELLLFADGERESGWTEHLDGCAECRCALGEVQGDLTRVESSLRSTVPSDSLEAQARSWETLRAAMAADAQAVQTHLTQNEFILYCDDELAPARARHLEICADCHQSGLDMQAFLYQVEHELRDLIPAEPRERRLASVVEFEKKLYPPKKVVTFPVRWSTMYAAAAAAIVAMFGGLWYAQQAPVSFETFALDRAPIAISGEEFNAPQPPRLSLTAEPELFNSDWFARVAVPAPAAIERFEFTRTLDTPATTQLALAPPALATQLPSPIRTLVNTPRVPAPRREAVSRIGNEQQLLAVLGARQAAVRAGVWSEDVVPTMREGRLTFIGTVEDAQTEARLIAAVREATSSEVGFDLTRRSSNPARAAVDAQVNDGPAGGVMRTALVEHYRDAARRSFRAPEASLLESEVTRYVNDVVRGKSDLVQHLYALKTLFNGLEPGLAENSGPEARKALRELALFHLSGAAEQEGVIFSRLSEALPRRYWNYRGSSADASNEAWAAESASLLEDALKLDRTLTSLFNDRTDQLDVANAQSPGELLHRIRTRLRVLRARSKTL